MMLKDHDFTKACKDCDSKELTEFVERKILIRVLI